MDNSSISTSLAHLRTGTIYHQPLALNLLANHVVVEGEQSTSNANIAVDI